MTYSSRASNDERVLWLVRRVDNVHICCNEVLVDGVRQVRSQVVGHIISEKFIQERRIYNPNDIRANMQHEYGVQLIYQ